MSNTSVSRFRAVAARPADEYAEFGSEPFPLRALVDVDRDELVRQFGVNPEVVEILRSGRATDVLREHPDLIPDAPAGVRAHLPRGGAARAHLPGLREGPDLERDPVHVVGRVPERDRRPRRRGIRGGLMGGRSVRRRGRGAGPRGRRPGDDRVRRGADAARRPGGVRRDPRPRGRRHVGLPMGRLRAAREPARALARPGGRSRHRQLERPRRLPPGVRHLPHRGRVHDLQRRRPRGVDEPPRHLGVLGRRGGNRASRRVGLVRLVGISRVGVRRVARHRLVQLTARQRASSTRTTARRTWPSRSRCRHPTVGC